MANARVPDSVMVDGMLVYRVDGSTDPFGKYYYYCLQSRCMSPSLVCPIVLPAQLYTDSFLM